MSVLTVTYGAVLCMKSILRMLGACTSLVTMLTSAATIVATVNLSGVLLRVLSKFHNKDLERGEEDNTTMD